MLELARSGPAPLSGAPASSKRSLRVATVIPAFRPGSGGHRTIVRLASELRARGHEVSLWLDDRAGWHARERPAATRARFGELFDARELPLNVGFEQWQGADVVLATGWQTVAAALKLGGVAARAYLVQDHEPDFYPPSAEALWAAQTYQLGLHCIAASAWLAELLRTQYGASATHFDLGVDADVYAPGDGARGEPARGHETRHDEKREGKASEAKAHGHEQPMRETRGHDGRRENLVVFYARESTPRRAVPLGLAALAELARRRPEAEIVLFGEDRAGRRIRAPLRWASAPAAWITNAAGRAIADGELRGWRDLGVLREWELAALYARASVGIVLSLTNPSLIALEMMASGLPCVELASEPILATFGEEGPLQLAAPDPLALCAAVERLLDDAAMRARLGSDGMRLVRQRSWRQAGEQVETGLRRALAQAGGE